MVKAIVLIVCGAITGGLGGHFGLSVWLTLAIAAPSFIAGAVCWTDTAGRE